MLYKGEDGKNRQLKPREKMPTINDKNREFWKKRTMTWHRGKIFFDQEIKTGTCFFCKRDGRAQRSRSTVLHHVKYNNDDPLDWTIEVCTKCHYQIDTGNRKIIDRHFGPRVFARAVDREAERIQYRRSHEERMRRYVRH